MFIDCKKYEEALREDPELWNIKVIGANSRERVQNPVNGNLVIIGLSECAAERGLLSPKCSHKLMRRLCIRTYTAEKDSGERCLEVLGIICKKLKGLFPNEIGNIKISKCEYVTAPYAYCAEAELDICDSYGDEGVLAESFKEVL